MAALTPIQFVALEAPQLSGVPLLKNCVTFPTLDAFFQTILDSNNQNVFLALAQIFRILTTEDRNASLRLDQFAYTRRTGMTFDDAREYWESKYRESLFSNKDIAPKIIPYGYGLGYGYGLNGGW